jgi:hypothetical protein
LNIPELSDAQLSQLLKDAQAEKARRDSNRFSLSDLRRAFSNAHYAIKNADGLKLREVNDKLEKLGVRIITIDGRLYVERVNDDANS